MSALGQYVHLSWQGYKNAGTYRDESRWQRQKTNEKGERIRQVKNNFDENIFIKYAESIRSRASSISIGIKDLKQKEQEYNKRREEELQRILSLNKDDDEYKSLLTASILNANLGKNINVDKILQELELDPETELPASVTRELGTTRLRSLASTGSKGAEGPRTYFKTIYDRIKKAEDALDKVQDKDLIQKPLSEVIKIKKWLKNARF